MNPNFWEILAAGIFIGLMTCTCIVGILWIKRDNDIISELEEIRRLLGL